MLLNFTANYQPMSIGYAITNLSWLEIPLGLIVFTLAIGISLGLIRRWFNAHSKYNDGPDTPNRPGN
jgi:hypothetical protein